MDSRQTLKAIPKVDLVLEAATAEPGLAALPRHILVESIRRALEKIRAGILDGRLTSVPGQAQLLADIAAEAKAEQLFSLRPVINATGVVLHTNLGRAVLSAEAAAHAAAVASSYSTLEYDTAEGARGSRHAHLEKILTRLTGCEAAMAVNNNAAAVMLIMAALFSGRELIVSRGELVEIGGAFRIPDIMELGGVALKAVGTTNRTRLRDYAQAIDREKTGGILKVHTSNFRIIGYTEQPELRELSELARAGGLPLVYDLGSGTFTDLLPLGIQDEPTVRQVLKEGVDLICFSGDKLLGGTQAGLVAGRRDLITLMKAHPLARALRVDKMTLAALEATLKMYLDPEEAFSKIPTLAMLFASPSELKAKAEALCRTIAATGAELELEVVATESQTGGGAAPEKPLPSQAVALKSERLSEPLLEERLRKNEPPVIVRTFQGRLLLDVRTIREDQFDLVAAALKNAVA
ncbi:L-seryl-tRNA(Sec) selenium transferase [Deltaproteobacteria bacterium Smac51]|nr:L-seryl-tRNA(Sec) selenium transferase [Deltaproteobacteria bacterium Smac51]